MLDDYRDPAKRKRDFLAGSIAVLSAQLIPAAILIKRGHTLPPITFVVLIIVILSSISVFLFTLRRHRELEEAFSATDLEANKQSASLLLASRVDLMRSQLMFMALNLLWATGISALTRT